MRWLGTSEKGRQFQRRFIGRRLLILVAFASGCVELNASNFEVEGTLSVTYFHGNTNQTKNTSYVVSVDGERWLIKTTFGEDYYTLHGCDGTSIYSFLHDPNPPRLPDNGRVASAPGLITAGVCPLDAAYYTFLPWLTFASGHYLDRSGDSVPAFWFIPRTEVMAWMFDSKVKRIQSPSQLPSVIEYITTDEKLASAPTNPELRVEGISNRDLQSRNIDLKAIVTSGFLGARFTVTSTTNFNGVEVPLTFEAVTYGFPDRSKSVITNMIFVGKVLRIGHSTYSSYLPPIEQTLAVVDYRFKSSGSRARVDCLKYFVTDSTWPSDKDPKLVKEFNLKKDRIPTFEAGPIIRMVFYTMLGIIFFLPVWFVLVKWKKDRSEAK